MLGFSRVVTIGLVLLLAFVGTIPVASAWSNGGYSADPAHPDYGTHDWIAQHALDWLPNNEKTFLLNNLAAYLYGTELPDNGGATDGIGDTSNHHVYFYSSGAVQDDAAALRASQESATAKTYLAASNYAMAAKTAGIMSHYVVDVAVFGHVMGASTDWGAEVHHSDYEDYVTSQMTSYVSSTFDSYLAFDGTLQNVTAYDATLKVAQATTFGDDAGTQSCIWMDANYDWTSTAFKDSTGASLNRAVNALADVLHSLAAGTGQPGPSPDTVNPTITITSPSNGASGSMTTLVVQGSASDNVGLQKVEVSADGGAWVQATGTTAWSASLGLSEGQHAVSARATDTSGNTATTTISVLIHVPTTSPLGGLDPLVAVTVLALATCLAIAGLALLLHRRRRQA